MKSLGIIIPAYNAEETIARCLDSVMEQCFTDFEIILVDDASTDKTLQIAESYQLKYNCIKIVTHKKNKGLGSTRNSGILHSTANYILFLDSDDTLVENSLSDIMLKTSETSADLIVFNYNFVNADGTLIKKTNFKNANYPDPLNFLSELLKSGSFGSGMANNKIYKRSVIQDNKMKFPENVYYEDMPFVFQYISLSSKISILTNFLFNYTQTNTSISNQIKSKHIRDNQRIIRLIKQRLIKQGIFKNIRSEWDYFYIRRNCNYLISKINDSQQILHEHLLAIDQKTILNNIEKLDANYLVYLGDYYSGNPPFRKKRKIIGRITESKNSPLVSYIMPVWNREKYLAEAIQSVLIQTYRNIELLIIDDESTDRTPDIIAKFAKKDSRIRTFKNHTNIGNTRSRNILLKESKGELIAFIDSDDYIHPQKTQRQINFLNKNPNYGAVGTFAVQFSETHRKICIKPIKHEDIFIGCFDKTPMIGTSVMIKRVVLESNHIHFDEQCSVAADYNLWTQLIKITRMANLPYPLYFWRLHNQSISSTQTDMQIKTADLQRMNMLQFITGRSVNEKEVHVFRRFISQSSDFQGNLSLLFSLLTKIQQNIDRDLPDYKFVKSELHLKLMDVISTNRKKIRENEKLKSHLFQLLQKPFDSIRASFILRK